MNCKAWDTKGGQKKKRRVIRGKAAFRERLVRGRRTLGW